MRTLLYMLLTLLTSTLVFAQNWSGQTSGTSHQLRGLHMINVLTGWTCGDAGTLMNTTDGGAAWMQNTVTGVDLHEVVFKDAITGVVVGDGGTIFRTTDGGRNWSSVNSATVSQLRGADWGSGDVVWAAGRDGAVVRSTDAGASWSALNTGVATRFLAIAAIGTDSAWVVGRNGVVLHTSNGGLTWTSQTNPATGNIQDVQFLDAGTGFACGSNSLVMYTADGGRNWVSRASGIAAGQNGLFFLDNTNGRTVGDGGKIYVTDNGGLTWAVEPSGTTHALNDVFFSDQSNGWIVGDFGTILHKVNPTGLTKDENSPVTSYTLEQNYPNPFNPQTTISFSLDERLNVRLEVFNISGQRVRSLVNKTLNPGQYRFTFQAGDLPSGVYFYRLNTGGNSINKQMLLVK